VIKSNISGFQSISWRSFQAFSTSPSYQLDSKLNAIERAALGTPCLRSQPILTAMEYCSRTTTNDSLLGVGFLHMWSCIRVVRQMTLLQPPELQSAPLVQFHSR
jgi:hypothetical protein